MDDLELALSRANKVLVLVGAGISVNAGIPDFRSPGSGVYAKHNIDPEDVFHIESFRDDPVPLFRLMAELLADGSGGIREFRPTLTHWFLKRLRDNGKLLRVYSQNIDGLDCEGIGFEPLVDVVQCHGHLRSVECSDCRQKPPLAFKDWALAVIGYLHKLDDDEKISIPTCLKCAFCDGYLKPSVVLFGEQLPVTFFNQINKDVAACDLVLVIGSSLTVFPFAAVPTLVPPAVLKFIVSKGPVSQTPGATVIVEDCDTVFASISDKLGFSA